MFFFYFVRGGNNFFLNREKAKETVRNIILNTFASGFFSKINEQEFVWSKNNCKVLLNEQYNNACLLK